MKKIKIILLALTAVSLSSCKKAKIDIAFNLNADNIYFNIDTTSVQGNITLSLTSFSSDLQMKLNENHASYDEVESIQLIEAQFKMINPGSQNFDIVDKAYAFLSTASNPEIRIASKDPVPDGVTNFSLETEGGNLKDYLKQSVINFKATGFTNAPNIQRDSLQVLLTFRIKAKINS